MKIKTLLTVIFCLLFLPCLLVPTPVIADTQINVPVKAQERSNWCWDASAQAVLSYYGKSESQCNIADYANLRRWGYSDNCCSNSGAVCNFGYYLDSGIYWHWGVFSSISGTYISSSDVVKEIDSKQPFVMSWSWTSGGGHELVGYGYDQNGLYIDYMDPIPGHGYTKSLYSWVVSASDHNWSDTLKTVNIGAPTGVYAYDHLGVGSQANVSFSPPAQNSGGAITYYTVTSNPGNITTTGATSPLTITGLTNGTAYTFTVTATNSNGTGLASLPSNSFTPCAVPGAPTGISATADLAQATVYFTAPSYNGGCTIDSYSATSNPNPGNIFSYGNASPITVKGLTGGTAYSFTVRAHNSAGYGPPSSISNSVTPTSSVPKAPNSVLATTGNAQSTISFTTPDSNGSSITSYTVTSNPGNITTTGATSPLTITGLTNGTAYTFAVTATNSVGTGPASLPSNSVTPYTVPAAPSSVSATTGLGQATVYFTAPSSNGRPITSYSVRSNPGNIIATDTASPITVGGLNGGTAYTFTVSATNIAGTGPVSLQSNSVTPTYTTPDAPTNVSAYPRNATAIVSCTAPAFNGYNLITMYTATSHPGNITATGSAAQIYVTGLTNGTAYTFTVTATNAAGTGTASNPSNSVTPLQSYINPVPALGTWGILTSIGVMVLFLGFRRKRI